MKLDKYFDYAKQVGFTDIEFKSKTSKKLSVGVFHHKVENYSVSENETIYIRGIYNGKMVSGITENKATITKIIDQMAENAKFIEEEKEQEIFGGSEKYKNYKTHTDALTKIPVSEKIDLCLKAEEKAYAYNEKIKDVESVEYEEVESAMTIINTKGLKLSYKAAYGVFVVGVVAKDGDDTRTGFKVKLGQTLEDFDVDTVVKEACDDAINALHGTQCDSKKYKVLFAPNVFSSLIGVLMSNVSGESVNKGRTLLKDKLHQEVASKKFTLIENPHTKEYPFFYRAFDDEGVATYKKAIIEKGVLNTFLYNIESAKEAKTTSTGNGYGGAAIGISTSFLQVKPGKKSKDEIVAKINNGIQITNVQGLHAGMNPLSGNFSLQASGYRIEDGKITTPVNLITIAGNLFEVFKDIDEVGNDLTLSYSGILTPSVSVKKLAISGK